MCNFEKNIAEIPSKKYESEQKYGKITLIPYHSYLNESAGLALAAFKVCEATARIAVNTVTSSAKI